MTDDIHKEPTRPYPTVPANAEPLTVDDLAADLRDAYLDGFPDTPWKALFGPEKDHWRDVAKRAMQLLRPRSDR